jgi:hypothetical protein
MGRRPGRSLATLLAAGTVSNLGDGVTLAAAPLLAASVTRDPRAIGAVGAAWSLPWLLFALVSGAVVDRSDRRRLMVGADLVRVVGLAGLTAAVVGGRASIPALVALFFVNAAAAPFAVDAASFGISALLLATIPGRFRAAALAATPDGPAPGPRPTLRADIAEGVRWLLGHRVLRTICWVLAIENIVEMAGLAMLVLLAATALPVVAGAGIALYGLAAVWWNVVTVSFRQAVVPERLQGRVNSAYRLVTWGTLSVGAAAGGVVAAQLGLRFLEARPA